MANVGPNHIEAGLATPIGAEIYPFDPVIKIDATVDSRTAQISLYASDTNSSPNDFRTASCGVTFSIQPDSSVRLTQLGNRPSSKQIQYGFALQFDAAGKLRITVGSNEGTYGADCFVCLQIYSRDLSFLTQAWIPLTSLATGQDVDLPAQAAFGCFAVQLAGSGVAADISVGIAARGRRAETSVALTEGIRAPEDLRALMGDDARLRDAFVFHSQLVNACVLHWYHAGNYHDIVHLLACARRLPKTDAVPGVLVPLLYFAARGLGNLNATRSALETLKEIWDVADWRSHLPSREIQIALLLQGQLCFKNGATDEGMAALDRARLNDPTHWEAYYLLAANLEDDQTELRDAYFRAAETLMGRPHPRLAVASIENELGRGRWGEALGRALAATAAFKKDHDVWLSLSNIYLQIGDLTSSRSFIDAYFGQFGLSAPIFDEGSQETTTRYMSIASAPSAAMSADRGRVAVIMTTFNSAQTVALAIRSVLTQSYPDLVLAVVDDGSTDGTIEIVEGFAARDLRVRVFRSDLNSGTYFCKNLAFSQVDADYYTFHDSDDWMHPERIARHLDTMEATGSMCTTSLWYRMGLDGRAILRHSGCYQHGNPASIFIRRAVRESLGYFDSVRTGADTEYVWRIRSRYGRRHMREIALPLGVGLHHDVSLTQSGVTAFSKRRYSQVRLEYWEAWVRWHFETIADDRTKLHVPFPLDERKHWAPEAITPEGGRRN